MVIQRARTAGGIPASHDFFVDCGEFGEVVVPQMMTIEEALAFTGGVADDLVLVAGGARRCGRRAWD